MCQAGKSIQWCQVVISFVSTICACVRSRPSIVESFLSNWKTQPHTWCLLLRDGPQYQNFYSAPRQIRAMASRSPGSLVGICSNMEWSFLLEKKRLFPSNQPSWVWIWHFFLVWSLCLWVCVVHQLRPLCSEPYKLILATAFQKF